MNGIAESVAKHLDLDVAGIGNRALENNGAIAERALRLGARAAQGIGEPGCIDLPHAAPATAGDGLDHHGKADLFLASASIAASL